MFRGFQRPQQTRPVDIRPSAPRRAIPRPKLSPSTKRMLITAAVIAAAAIVLFASSAFWVNWWWFGSMGHRDVLTTRYTAQVLSFVVGAALAAGVFGGNLVLALRRTRQERPSGRLVAFAERTLFALLIAATAVVAVIFGLTTAQRWETWLLWFYGDAFGLRDPVFDRDVGFFVFALPALHSIEGGAFALMIATVLAVAVVYIVRLGMNVRSVRGVPRQARVHLLALGGAILVVIAFRNVLANYDLVYSHRGVVFGASYTDVHAQRLANWALAILSLVIAGLLLVNAFVQRIRLLIGAIALWAVASVVLGYVVPAAIQQTVVEPSELTRERPYIANNVAMTRAAFDLNDVGSRELSGQAPVSAAEVSRYPETLENIRLWDYRIIRGTYQQLQSFVSYYVFRDVDVDRYFPDGTIEQVVVSARELDPDGLPETAQTWTNRHLVYTHGYGAVVSPVGQVSPQGLPRFFVERIPPTGTGVYTIQRPEIYFGEGGEGWVAVNTAQGEFAGTIDADGVPATDYRYEGDPHGSIKLDNYLTRLLLAAHLGERNVLLSGSLTDQSQVLIFRNITQRIAKIAPFLRLDDDPYLVIADGKLYWIVDAYTGSAGFPHATRSGGVNYLRNSVKIVVDAYDGTTTFYRTTEPDPIADAYGEIFGDLFTPIAEAPVSIAAHWRYPDHLFDVQSDVFASFHVTDPTAFYNGEDRWAVPMEQVEGTPARMEPYNVTMTLPGETNPEFALIRPFIPGGRTNRQNMTAWMAGRLGENGALSLVLYRFPRQETVFGPAQIEARIDQEPDISSQISLWNRSGSEVIRGNLLVIPIGESILYVQPLYLQATNTQGALPELKRVIVASNERVIMRETLPDALAALTQGSESATGPIEAAPEAPVEGATAITSLAQQALDVYQAGQAALARADWTAYGNAQAELQRLLEQIAALSSGSSAQAGTPAAAATPSAGT
ncbi:MAG: uncharacterized protein QOF01_5420 [Thermomicrobiales bacterium]|nr:uncharacterized protein [Thermomicrobiales bacterium]